MIRKIHAYIGLLIGPSVLFFAFSGTLQIFSLHESHGPYHAPALLQTMGHLHKDQVLSEPEERHGPPPGVGPVAASEAQHAGPPDHDDDQTPKIKTYVLKWVFALVGLGLFVSILCGLWIGLRFTRTPRLSWGLLIVGAALPVLILIL